MATAQSRKRTDYLIDIGNNKVVAIKAIKSSIQDIDQSLGYVENATGEIPQGKILVGEGREDALLSGCFPIAVYYLKNKQKRRVVLLVSPTKADTVATELKTKKYAGSNIIKVTPVRRRKFTY
ncbi:MAG: hypothetical protein HXY43_02065 [Fischerella sp.]|jgi:hypothetical protein|uniref:hypothetical protein n=1 Tax=Fischerella sp. TaxID=1191 RepID=UPI001824601D|nr:hypothetical protein [Fischerella sp.]NWF58120.1 hypothetical protein [Fischerella sp.]